MNSKNKIAVIIVTFNRSSELKLTIDSIASQGISHKDIFVINNNSSDGTLQMLEKDYPDINLINLPDNIASAGGFAQGMQIVHHRGYRWAWLFNDDSRPVNGALDSLMPYLSESSKYNIGLLKIANVNEQGQAILLYWNGVRKPVYTIIGNDLIPTDLVTFDGCMVSSELMSKIGYCDPLFFMGTYEFDYCLRAKEDGFKIYTIPNGLIEDKKLGGENGIPPWRQYYNTRNHLWLGLNRRSFIIIKAWLIRELKLTYHILFRGDKKFERLSFKARAIRDALLNVRGRRYLPE